MLYLQKYKHGSIIVLVSLFSSPALLKALKETGKSCNPYALLLLIVQERRQVHNIFQILNPNPHYEINHRCIQKNFRLVFVINNNIGNRYPILINNAAKKRLIQQAIRQYRPAHHFALYQDQSKRR